MKRTIGASLVLFCLLLLGARSASAVGNDNTTGVTGEFAGSITTGGTYDPYTGNAKRLVDDLTVTGSVGAYPLKWTRVLNTRSIYSDWSHSYAEKQRQGSVLESRQF